MRLFISFMVPVEFLEKPFAKVRETFDKVAKITWVPVDKQHVTLKFLGEVQDDKVDEIIEKLEKIKFNTFEVELDKLGAFPSESYARVLWLGVRPVEEIIKLKDLIEDELIDFEKDKRFHPHVTFGRVKFINNKDRFKENLKLDLYKGKFHVDKFELVRSELRRTGAVYTVLKEFKLLD